MAKIDNEKTLVPRIFKAEIANISFPDWHNSGRVFIQHTADDTAEMVTRLIWDITGKREGDELTEGEIKIICAAIQAQGHIAAAAFIARNAHPQKEDY